MKLDTILERPEALVEWGSPAGMSNYEHTVEEGAEEALRDGHFMKHAGWEFNGDVWAVEGGYVERVHRYHSVVGCYFATTLRQLMEVVNEDWGAE